MTSPLGPSGPDRRPPSVVPSVDARERVVDALSHHFAEDRLSMEEFERRVEAAYAAGGTGELDALVADLPAARGAAVTPRGARGAVAAEEVPAQGRIVSVLSSREGAGHAAVPRYLKVVAVMGNVELDLRDATFGAGATEIEVAAFMGNVEITVPPNAQVELLGRAILGSFGATSGAPRESTSREQQAGIVIHVTGRAVLSNAEITVAPARRVEAGDPQGRVTR